LSFQDRKHHRGGGAPRHHLAYLDEGEGPLVVLLHGNPTSSYLWREVIPPLVASGARCVAPDLLGMGDSDGLPDSGPERYTFAEHAEHLGVLLDRLVPAEGAVLVLHDWGSALGFHWAHRHPDRVRGLAYMEALVRPFTWDQWPRSSRRIFQAMRSEEGERLVLEENAFVERILPASVLRELGEGQMAEYRRPFAQAGESRRPTLTWPRQLPIDGEPADVHDLVAGYSAWLAEDERIPKLFVDADPGSILVGEQREFAAGLPHQTRVTVPGSHFVQEDSGRLIGEATAAWLADVGVLR
jgi:haloalkane dehalogenase